MLKKFSKARGWGGSVHGGGDTGAEGGISKEKEAGTRAAPSRKTIPPHRMGPHPGRGRGKGHRGTQVSAGRRGWLISLTSQAQGSLVKAENKQTHHGARWHPFG